MAITLVDSTSSQDNDNAPSASLTGVQENDVIIALVNSNNDVTITDDSGSYPTTAAIDKRNYNGTSASYRIFYRVAGSSDTGTYTFSLSGAQSHTLILHAYRGVDTSTPFDVQCSASTENTGSSTDVATNSLVTQNNNAMIVAFGMGDTSAYTFTDDPGDSFTSRENQSFYRLTSSSDKVLATAGTQNSVSWTMSSSTGFATQIFSLKEASSGPEATSFSSDDSFPSGENAAVVGTKLDTVTGVTIDGVDGSSDFSASSATAATQDTPSLTDTQQSGFPAYGAIDYVITDGSTPDTLEVTHVAPSGKQYVTLAGTLNTDSTQSLIPYESGFTIVAGDQLIVDSTATGGASPAINISYADGTFSFEYTDGVTYTFDFQFLDVSTNTLYGASVATVRDGAIVSGIVGSVRRKRAYSAYRSFIARKQFEELRKKK